MVRMIDDRELEARIGELLEAETGLARAKGRADLRRWLKEQPEMCFVGATAAAEILGIQAPHIARLRKRNRLPIPIPVEGGYPVYLRSEIEALAEELNDERRARKR